MFRSTCRLLSAYRLLDEAGVISTQRGRGTYVLEPLPPDRAHKLRKATLEGLARTYLAIAATEGFTPDEVRDATRALLEQWRSKGKPPPIEE
jgi:DNA-binding transcriptional regulator YhcF (GntR family)